MVHATRKPHCWVSASWGFLWSAGRPGGSASAGWGDSALLTVFDPLTKQLRLEVVGMAGIQTEERCSGCPEAKDQSGPARPRHRRCRNKSRTGPEWRLEAGAAMLFCGRWGTGTTEELWPRGFAGGAPHTSGLAGCGLRGGPGPKFPGVDTVLRSFCS